MIFSANIPCTFARRWRFSCDGSALLSLIAVALLLKIIVLLQSPILARDGIHHLHFAYDLTERPWTTVLREHPYHPGYAYSVVVASMIYELYDPGALTPSEWQWCGHLSSALAGILLVIPLYGLARCFYSIRTAWLGALLFLLLPVVVQTTTDALTESWYLLFVLTALWTLVQGVRSQRSSWFVITGLLAGAGYLVRVEALIIPGIYLVWMFLIRWQRRQLLPSGTSLRNIALLTSCFLLPPLPYMMTIGKISNRPVVQAIAAHDTTERFDIAGPTHLFATQRLQDGVNGIRLDAIYWFDALKLVVLTHARAGHYFLWPLAFLGFVIIWRSRQHDPATWLLLSFFLLHTFMLSRLAFTAGYASERHLLLALAFVAQLAAVGIVSMKPWLRQRLSQNARITPAMNLTLALVIAGLCLPKALQPLHRSQEAHRQAGYWLADHLEHSDLLVDPYHWASFYAGVSFMPKRTSHDSHSTLGIIDPRDADLNRQQAWKDAKLQEPEAKTIWHWPAEGHPKLIIRQAMLHSIEPPAILSGW